MRQLLSCAALIACTATAGAQSTVAPALPDQRGFSIGLDPLVYAQLSSDGITSGRNIDGFGVALRFGWGFTQRIALVMDVAVTDFAVADTARYLLSHGDVLLRYTPLARRGPLGVWAPFVTAGLGFRDIDASGGISPTGTRIYVLSGEEFTLGGGVAVFRGERLSIYAAAYWSRGEFNDERIGNTTTHSRHLRGQSTRYGLGATWNFQRRSLASLNP